MCGSAEIGPNAGRKGGGRNRVLVRPGRLFSVWIWQGSVGGVPWMSKGKIWHASLMRRLKDSAKMQIPRQQISAECNGCTARFPRACYGNQTVGSGITYRSRAAPGESFHQLGLGGRRRFVVCGVLARPRVHPKWWRRPCLKPVVGPEIFRPEGVAQALDIVGQILQVG